jgi:hypothetical protein
VLSFVAFGQVLPSPNTQTGATEAIDPSKTFFLISSLDAHIPIVEKACASSICAVYLGDLKEIIEDQKRRKMFGQQNTQTSREAIRQILIVLPQLRRSLLIQQNQTDLDAPIGEIWKLQSASQQFVTSSGSCALSASRTGVKNDGRDGVRILADDVPEPDLCGLSTTTYGISMGICTAYAPISPTAAAICYLSASWAYADCLARNGCE